MILCTLQVQLSSLHIQNTFTTKSPLSSLDTSSTSIRLRLWADPMPKVASLPGLEPMTFQSQVRCPTARLNVHPWGVNIFKVLWDCWAEVDETWHVYSMGWGAKRLERRTLNFGPCAAWDHRELQSMQEWWPSRVGWFCLYWVCSFLMAHQHKKAI